MVDTKRAGKKLDPTVDGEPLGGRTAVRGSGPAPPATFAELKNEYPRRADESAAKYRERLSERMLLDAIGVTKMRLVERITNKKYLICDAIGS